MKQKLFISSYCTVNVYNWRTWSLLIISVLIWDCHATLPDHHQLLFSRKIRWVTGTVGLQRALLCDTLSLSRFRDVHNFLLYPSKDTHRSGQVRSGPHIESMYLARTTLTWTLPYVVCGVTYVGFMRISIEKKESGVLTKLIENLAV